MPSNQTAHSTPTVADLYLALPKGVLGYISDPDGLAAYLTPYYTEPHRAYHNLSHLIDLAHEWNQLRAHQLATEDSATWLAALLWHDLIYQPGQPDNESKSAAKAALDVPHFIPGADLPLVLDLIFQTSRHGQDLSSLPILAKLFLDTDMAILGSSPSIYQDYTAAIAAEFVPCVGQKAYQLGRQAFLTSVLATPHVFLSDFYITRREEQAFANLSEELALYKPNTHIPNSPQI